MNLDYFRKWCMNKMINIIVVSAFLLFVIFIIFVAGISKGFQTVNTSSSVLSSKKIGWGIKRNSNHEQPDLGLNNKKTIEEFGGIAIGSLKQPYLYLTFDVGYEGGYTNKILDTLKDNNVKSTFFITGQFFKTNPEIVKRMIDEGHIVGNQSPHTLMEL